MLINYEGYDIIIDTETDFCQLAFCYRNGCNCYNCFEAITDGCPLDNIDLDKVYEIVENEM